MITIIKKEIEQFWSSLTGYIAIGVFLILCGFFLFVIPGNSIFDFNILEYGYASMEKFFKLAPWILLLLIPAITMRLFADEYKLGTFEILKTKPLKNWDIILGKYFGALLIVILALMPTIVYVLAIRNLSTNTGIDVGEILGSYIGLFFLSAVFVSIGLYCSSFTNNAVTAFIISIVGCLVIYFFFTAISRLPFLKGGVDYYLESLGLDFHYKSISRGVIDTRDIIYFISIIILFLLLTFKNIAKNK